MSVIRAQDTEEHVDCAVVIVTYNSARDIVGLLESLPAAAAGLTLRLVIVDNGSTDATVGLVRERPGVITVESGANLGYAAGLNIGRAYAGDCSALLLLNPDMVLQPGAIREMFTVLDDSAIGIVVPMLLDADGQLCHSLRREPSLARALGEGLLGDHLGRRPGWLSEIVRGKKPYRYQHSVDWATGAAMLVSTACDRQVGQWDEQFFLYSEEVDYAARARDAGFRVEYLPAARALHHGGGSGRSGYLAALLAVNRIRYMEKRGRGNAAYRMAVILHEMLRSGDPGHRAALRAILRRSTWPALTESLRTSSAGTNVESTPWQRDSGSRAGVG